MKKLIEGQRVRSIRDLPDTIHPIHLYKGDEGIVSQTPSALGFQSDRWGDIVSINRKIDGEMQAVLNYCEPIEAIS